MQTQIQKLLEGEVIRHSQSPWIVMKTVKDKIGKVLYKLGKAMYFLDLATRLR